MDRATGDYAIGIWKCEVCRGVVDLADDWLLTTSSQRLCSAKGAILIGDAQEVPLAKYWQMEPYPPVSEEEGPSSRYRPNPYPGNDTLVVLEQRRDREGYP